MTNCEDGTQISKVQAEQLNNKYRLQKQTNKNYQSTGISKEPESEKLGLNTRRQHPCLALREPRVAPSITKHYLLQSDRAVEKVFDSDSFFFFFIVFSLLPFGPFYPLPLILPSNFSILPSFFLFLPFFLPFPFEAVTCNQETKIPFPISSSCFILCIFAMKFSAFP